MSSHQYKKSHCGDKTILRPSYLYNDFFLYWYDVLNLIIIIKSEVWPICHCLGLGHETMVCAVCLLIFLRYLYTCMLNQGRGIVYSPTAEWLHITGRLLSRYFTLTLMRRKWSLNALRPTQNGHHVADNIVKCVYVDENVWISIKKHHWSLFLRVQFTINQLHFGSWLGTEHQVIAWTNDGLAYWIIYASFTFNELRNTNGQKHLSRIPTCTKNTANIATAIIHLPSFW